MTLIDEKGNLDMHAIKARATVLARRDFGGEPSPRVFRHHFVVVWNLAHTQHTAFLREREAA